MLQRGRKSTGALTVIHSWRRRVEPDEEIPTDQHEIWLRVIEARPPDWFGEEHRDMLRSYCRHVAYGNMIGKALDRVTTEWLCDPNTMLHYSTLYKMHQRETQAATQWATRMRLTHQSLDKKTAGTKARNHTPGPKPWEAAAS